MKLHDYASYVMMEIDPNLNITEWFMAVEQSPNLLHEEKNFCNRTLPDVCVN